MRRIAGVVGLLVVVVAVFAACTSSGGGGPKPNVTTGVVITGTNVAVPTGTPLSASDLTALAVGTNVDSYDPYTDPAGRFTVDLPRGWRLLPGKYGVSATLLSSDPQYPASAIVGVGCLEGVTVDYLVQQDRNVQQSIGEGDFSLTNATPTTVDGVPAQEVRWQGAYLGTAHDHDFIYFQEKGCAWRILLTTYPNVTFDSLRPVLDHLVASFRAMESPTPAATPAANPTP